ncbi:MAG TPA: hypothetical protein VGS07_02230 [Thermoanaerobaculia bacterium]|jgi:hypothetical protein|nr:hypothetical protein [Thermoanaerobaculia bacterium]
MRHLAVLGLLFLSAPVLGDDLYTFSIENRGGLEESVQTGKVFAAGSSYRMELGPKDGELPLYPVVLSQDGGEHETAIDPAHRFYYSPKQGSGPTSSLFSLFPLRPLSRSVTNIQFTVLEQDEPEPISGLKTREVEIRLSYDIKVQLSKIETVAGKVSLNAKYWMAADREVALPVRLRPTLRAGIPEIDSRLSVALAKLRGLPVKQELTLGADSPGSEPQKLIVTRTLRDLRTVAAKPGRFEVPKGFQYHEPQFSRALPPDHPQLFGPEKTPPPGN